MINRWLLRAKRSRDDCLFRYRKTGQARNVAYLLFADALRSLLALTPGCRWIFFDLGEAKIRGGCGIFHDRLFVVHVQVNGAEGGGISPFSERLEGSRPDQPTLVTGGVLQRLGGGRIRIRGKNLGGRSADWRGIIFGERLNGLPAETAEGDETDAFGYSDASEFLGVPQYRLLGCDQSL